MAGFPKCKTYAARSSGHQGNSKGVVATRQAAVELSNSCSFAATSGSNSSQPTHTHADSREGLRRREGCWRVFSQHEARVTWQHTCASPPPANLTPRLLYRQHNAAISSSEIYLLFHCFTFLRPQMKSTFI